jgi:hypothetical protein
MTSTWLKRRATELAHEINEFLHDIDGITVFLMVKGSLPPIIYMAMFQSSTVAGAFGPASYIGAIVSGFTVAARPRGMFIQSMMLSLVSHCLVFGAKMVNKSNYRYCCFALYRYPYWHYFVELK